MGEEITIPDTDRTYHLKERKLDNNVPQPITVKFEGTMFAVGCSKLKSNLKEEIKHYRKSFFFFYLGFLSRTLTNQGTAGEGGGYLLPLPPTSHALRH